MGIPDIENIMAISALFDVSIDELLSNDKGTGIKADYLFESVTEYDIDRPKRYDMKFGGAKQLVLSGYDGEKIRVRLASNTLPSLQNDLKIKTRNVLLDHVTGTVEINCNLDMNVVCRSLKGDIAINQTSATSKISIPEGTVFTAVTKGIGTSISFERDGKPVEAFDSPGAENIIELNGMKSELYICTQKEASGQ